MLKCLHEEDRTIEFGQIRLHVQYVAMATRDRISLIMGAQ